RQIGDSERDLEHAVVAARRQPEATHSGGEQLLGLGRRLTVAPDLPRRDRGVDADPGRAETLPLALTGIRDPRAHDRRAVPGTASRKSTPRWASVTSPGWGGPPPPIRPETEIVWCGARNGRRVMSAPGRGRSPATLQIAETSRTSSLESGGRIAARRRASMVLPPPGGPTRSRLWAPAAAISSARLACAWPRTSRRSAGARFTVIRSTGKAKPALRIAVRTRSRLSRTAESGSPTVVKAGSPAVTSTSTRTSAASTPTRAAESTRAITP